MGKLTILALRIVIAMVLAGSLFVQVRMVPLLSADLVEAGAPDGPRLPCSRLWSWGFCVSKWYRSACGDC